MYKRESNYQDLLKTILIIAYILDHLGLYFLPEYKSLRVIGRIVMPGFCFFAGYNFHGIVRTKLLFFGLVLVGIDLLLGFNPTPTNILLPIYLGQAYLFFFKDKLKDFYVGFLHVTVLGMLGYFTQQYLEYGTVAIAIMVIGYMAKTDKYFFPLYAGSAVLLEIFLTCSEFKIIINNYLISYIILHVILYAALIALPLAKPISINLAKISRNSLIIYFADLAIMKVGLYCYLLLKVLYK